MGLRVKYPRLSIEQQCASYGEAYLILRGSGATAMDLEDRGEMPRLVPTEELFKGRHFDQEIVVLCVHGPAQNRTPRVKGQLSQTLRQRTHL